MALQWRLAASVVCIAFAIGLPVVHAAPAGPTEFLKQIDRNLCRKFDKLRCKAKRAPTSKRSPKKAAPKADVAAPDPPPVPVLRKDQPQQAKANQPAENAPTVALPRLRPQSLGPQKQASAAPPPAVVLPRLKPAALSRDAAVPAPLPVEKKLPGSTKVVVVVPKLPPVAPLPPSAKPRLPEGIETSSACLAQLTKLGVGYKQAASPANFFSGCSVSVPVTVSSIPAGGVDVQLPEQPLVNCAFALRLATWLQQRGQPIAMGSAGSAISAFYTGPGFQCRGRNGDVTAKISEHGYGNAVDIERIVLKDKRVLAVRDASNTASPSYPTLNALRQSACLSFTTVLGPGANAAHAEHFHFDLGRHGTSGAYVICE